MARRITQRELRNDSGEIMRRLDAGESFVVTRRGVAVGELIPVRRRIFASRDRVLEVFASAPPVDHHRLLADLDEVVDQDPAPRG
jgi:antitoxin (DNA-binding transcriptional repressor) of toxin-antitoxin stability system